MANVCTKLNCECGGTGYVELTQGGVEYLCPNVKVLHLTLSKQPFDVMVTGEKTEEFRKNSKWITTRLFTNGMKKDYDVIKFVNGYGADKPYFICKFHGCMKCIADIGVRNYSNGLKVEGIGQGDFIIYCGDIIEKGNLK